MSNKYGSGLFECTDDFSSFADTCAFGYCTVGRIDWYLEKNKTPGITAKIAGLWACLDFSITGGALIMWESGKMRQRINKRYGITNDEGCLAHDGDADHWKVLLKGCCCASCSNAQISREMYKRGEFAGGVFYQPIVAPPAAMGAEVSNKVASMASAAGSYVAGAAGDLKQSLLSNQASSEANNQQSQA